MCGRPSARVLAGSPVPGRAVEFAEQIERALAPARDVTKPFLASGLTLVLGVKEGTTNPVEMDGGSSSGSGASAE